MFIFLSPYSILLHCKVKIKFNGMQENERLNFPPIKGRVYKYLKHKGISQKKFFDTTGVSSSSFSSKNANSEFGGEIISRISIEYPLMSTRWMLTGEGEMEETPKIPSIVNGSNNILAHGHNTRIHQDLKPEQPNRLLDSSHSWIIQELENKNRQITEKDEQIRRLTEMLIQSQETISALIAQKK